MHESHVPRQDWFVSLLEEVVVTLLWFQPVVWVILSESAWRVSWSSIVRQ